MLLAALAVPATAQKKVTKISFGDTITHKFIPTGIRVGVDAIGLLKSRITSNWTGWEANADIDFWRYFVAAEIGNWSRNEILENGTYTNNGTYFRFGADVNFMLKEREKNNFFMGLRYGVSNFREATNFTYTDSANVTGPSVSHTIAAHHSGIQAHWFEITAGLKVKIWGPFWMGYVARLKLAPSIRNDTGFHPFDVPGYGIAEKGSTWGINYQLIWKFPLPRIK